MTDTKRNGISTLHHDSDAPASSDSNSGGHNPTTNEPAVQKRTRSQLNVPDLILRLPLSRSPLKDARKAHAKARSTSPMSQWDSQPHIPGDSQLPPVDRTELVAGSSVVTEAGTLEAVQRREEEEMEAFTEERAQQHEEEEDSIDSLFSPASQEGHRENPSQHTTWPTATKKRVSPDADTMCAVSSPGSERQPKRPKVESFLVLGRGREHSEYHEPLRDPDASTPGRPKGHKRTLSTKQTPSPSKAASSIFPPRAQSVPLGGETEVRAIDLTTVPASPRRSPSKGGVEVRRALSVPPDDDQMDVDVGDNTGLLHFTNPTQFGTPRADPVFCYTVNFATPRGPVTPPRCSPFASPLSPLTPLPSPFAEHLPEMQSLLNKNANAKSPTPSSRMGSSIDTGSVTVRSVADPTASRDIFQSARHVPSRPSSTAPTPRRGSTGSGSAPSMSRLTPLPTTSNSTDLISPPPVPERESGSMRDAPMAGCSSQAEEVPPNNSNGAGKMPTGTPVELSSAPRSRPDLNVLTTSRPSVIGSMKPKRGPPTQQGPRRVTRSASMKVERVNDERVENEDAKATSSSAEIPNMVRTTAAEASQELTVIAPPSTTVAPKLRPPKSIGTMISKPKPAPAARRSTSVSKPLPDPSKLKQASLSIFIKRKPSTIGGGDSTARTSTSTGSSSRVATFSSPFKIPLPTSPVKRPPTTQAGYTKPLLFSLGSTSTGVGTGTPRTTSGRSLTTLSHALDKLVVPPPSRPNTSMGFVRDGGASDEESTAGDGKGKEKAKDDASLPSTSTAQGSGTTFARPTASSLNRAATVAGFGSTTKMRGRGGAAIRGRGAMGIFGRVGDRASKKTNLPVVAGSPVKGWGSAGDLDRDGLGTGKHKSTLSLDGAEDAGGTANEDDVFLSRGPATGDDPEQDTVMQVDSAEALASRGGSAASRKSSPPGAAGARDGVDHIDLTTPISLDKGKQRALSCLTLNPASSALHALSESLSSMPHTPTPPKPRVVGTRTGLRSSTTAAGKESPSLDGSGSVGPSGNEVHGSGGVDPNNGTVNGSGGAKKSSLKILKRCTIFVDVRTEQGDDAGSLFVDMLKGLGARIMSRLGRKCTHIVYKNGHSNTLTRYRILDPKPVVVGIAWVVECVEKRAMVNEERFEIDVDSINVAGGIKRRRSMLPKHLIPTSPGPVSEMLMHTSSEADEDDGGGGIDGSQDPDLSMRSREEDDLPPLERARRRRSILPGGQTRLVP